MASLLPQGSGGTPAPELLSHVSFVPAPHACATFTPNRLRADFCTKCACKIWAHERVACPSDEAIIAALEYTIRGRRRPSEIIPGLFLGGLDAAINSTFLAKAGVTGICTAAGGLEMFGPKWVRGRRKAEQELHIEFLDLGLRDDKNQQVQAGALLDAVSFVHRHRSGRARSIKKTKCADSRECNGDSCSGGGKEKADPVNSCLVHCAMGKSRSTMVVIAYLLSLPVDAPGYQEDVDGALAFIKTKRRMAQPNSGFIVQLKEMNRARVFAGFLA